MNMVVVFWLFVIVECLILIVLGMLGKLTKIGFAIVAALTVLGSLMFLFLGKGTKNSLGAKDINRKEIMYMATALIENDDAEGALNALNQIEDKDCAEYEIKALRGLAYNLDESYVTCVTYYNDYIQNAELVPNELEQSVLSASMAQLRVSDEQISKITGRVKELLDFNDAEQSKLMAEGKIKYGTFKNEDEKKEAYTKVDQTSRDYLTELKEKIYSGNSSEAYKDLLEQQDKNSTLRDDILVTNMYINFAELHSLQNDDSEYDFLFAKANDKFIEYNNAAIAWNKFSEESKDKGIPYDEYSQGSEYREYISKNAEYNLALKEYRKESYKRAINYLSGNPESESYGYCLQMAKLYFLTDDVETATEYLDDIFKQPEINTDLWLGTQLKALVETYLEQTADFSTYEFDKAFSRLMNGLYQNVFPKEDNTEFRTFVKEYLHELYSGLSVSNVNADAFPVISVDISTTDETKSVNKDTVIIEDTFQIIDEYDVTKVETSDTSICFVQDISGSMNGTYIADSIKALLNASKIIRNDTKIGLVSFDNDAYLLCPVGSSRSAFNNAVNSLKANGGTNIAAGLQMGAENLHGRSGKKVIMLLSDGYDGNSAGLDPVLKQLQAEGITVHAIGLQGCDENYMQRIATSTGGEFVKVDNTRDLGKIYEEFSKYMTSVYRVTYTVDVKKLKELSRNEELIDSEESELYRYVQASGRSDYSRARSKYTLKSNAVSNYVDPNAVSNYSNIFKQIIIY